MIDMLDPGGKPAQMLCYFSLGVSPPQGRHVAVLIVS